MLIHEMTKSECQRILACTRLGRLACARENQPYVVPIYFVYEEPYVYGFTSVGQKVEWMRSNPLVCVEVDDVKSFDQWTSILLFERYEELPGLPAATEFDQEQRRAHEPWPAMNRPESVSPPSGQEGRLHAYALLQKHAEWWEPGNVSCTHGNPEQPLIPVYYRVRIDRITGRRATPGSRGPATPKKVSPAGKSQSWLRRILRALSKPPKR